MKKYSSIEILRFFTSLSILFYHYRHFFYPFNKTSNLIYEEISISLPMYKFFMVFYEYGFIGVHVFYTISGFVFAHIYLNNENKINYKNFFLNRFSRLYPLHFATLILVTLIQIFSYLKFHNFQIVLINDFYHFVLNLLFISSWGFEQGHSFNAPIWSVSVEIGIYIIFFFMLNLIKKFKIILIIFLSLTLLVVDKLKIFDTLFLECARLFFSGTLLFYIIKFKLSYKITFTLSILLIIVSIVGNFKTFIFCPSLLLLFLSTEKLLNNKTIQIYFNKLGNLTYSLYLLHLPAQMIFLIVFKLFNLPENFFINKIFIFFYFFSLIVAANYCFQLYEKRLNTLLRKKYN